ncbi:MAG: histidinol dehydrogenase [Armatimonadota bacterium]
MDPDKEASVRQIIDDVRTRGDAALRELSVRYDKVEFECCPVPDGDFDAAYQAVSREFLDAVRTAAENIRRFHENQVPRSWFATDETGAILGQLIRPLERVGLYAPGGTATYPSTVLMTAVPAKVAGVEQVILCTPPRFATPHVLVAAREAGVSSVYRLGGVPAIAAMAFGTESVPKVDKICGPGGPYVVLAKKLVYGHVGIESLPGPSEVLVVADDSARADWVAADMLSQAEHGGVDGESPCILVTPSQKLADEVAKELELQLSRLDRREIAESSVRSAGFIVVTRTLEEAAEVATLIAPEHLELVVRDPWYLLPMIRNAGAVLVGEWTPEPIGDYVAGPSHVLPTGGTARFSSPLNVEDFVKRSSLIRYSRAALKRTGPAAVTLAKAEGFGAHAAAVECRLAALQASSGDSSSGPDCG